MGRFTPYDQTLVLTERISKRHEKYLAACLGGMYSLRIALFSTEFRVRQPPSKRQI